MAHAGHGDEACKTADSAGNGHSPDRDLFNADASVAGSVLTVAYHGDFIAVLGVFQIDVHAHRQCHHQDDVQTILLTENFRKPAVFGLLVNHTHRVGADGKLP